jgi:hypothetical protein
MAFNPNLPAPNSPIVSAELRDQFNGLKALIDLLYPIGCVAGYLKSLANVPALPGTWLECNGQVVNDAESPLNGVNLPDVNGAQGGVPCFLRGAIASGGTGGSELHSHDLSLNINGGLAQQGADLTVFPPGQYQSDPASSLPTYYEVVWVVRVK